MQSSFSWSPSRSQIEASSLQKFLSRHGLGDYAELVEKADADPAWFWDSVFRHHDIRFDKEYRSVVEYTNGPEQPEWCLGGTTNIVLNCIDRHAGTAVWEKPAIVGVGEDGTERSLTYRELDREIAVLAGILKARGIGKGDVVAIYLPMVPEAAVALFAIMKIGAIMLPLFSGFGPEPIAARLAHAGVKAIVTADVALRRGKQIALLDTVLDALEDTPSPVEVIVLDRETGRVREGDGRYTAWRPGAEDVAPVPTEIVEADSPAMLIYTSGTSGAPKGTIHTHCGMLAKNALDMGLCIDMGRDDRLLWMSDMGWIAGPKMIFASALFGATLIIVEGTPTWPQNDRLFKIAAEQRATILGLVPTIIRQIMKSGGLAPEGRDLSALKCIISAGEPWTEEAWLWFFETVGESRVPILNYAGGTECGGAILIGTMHHPSRPCSFGGPVPGSGVDIVDPQGEPVETNVIGELVLRRASIGLTRGLWREPDRYMQAYWSQIPGMWVQGDLASRDEHGLWYLHGRSDDVIKIAGKRTGPSEIESVVMQTGLVKDCAVVGVDDPLSGSALLCVYVPAGDDEPDASNAVIREAVAERCGASFRPKHFLRVTELPRTRNDKSMRRILRSIFHGTPLGDTSSLANPAIIDSIRSAFTDQIAAPRTRQ
jgi:acetyl-CoA synthetase